MSPKRANGAIPMHDDLRLIPLKKQVQCIWLSELLQNHDELAKRTGINLMYIKPILKNKEAILKSWKDIIKKRFDSEKKDYHTGIDILLLEWVKSSINPNKIDVYKVDIERQAEILKQIFKLPTYWLTPEIWNKINALKENKSENRKCPEFVPHNISSIFKTNGHKLLENKTYIKFSQILATTTKGQIASDEQNDDLIIIEKPIECIDVTDDSKITSVEDSTGCVEIETSSLPQSDHYSTLYQTEEISSDFLQQLTLKLHPAVSINKEFKNNNENSLNEFPEVEIKTEILESSDQTQYTSVISNELPIQINKTPQANVVIKLEDDVQEEFIDITGKLPNESLENNDDFKNDTISDENQHKNECDNKIPVLDEDIEENCFHGGFEILEFEPDETEDPKLQVDDNDNEDVDNNCGDSDSEIEYVYEIEDSDEETQNELQRIINDYRKKKNTKTDQVADENVSNSLDDECDQEETITVVEIMSEDDADCVDELKEIATETISSKTSNKRKKNDKLSDDSFTIDNENNNREKHKRVKTLIETEECFDTNLPSTSRLAAANLSSSLSTNENPVCSSLPSQEITLENDIDAIKYLQHIKNYLLLQNDEHGVKLIRNLQLAFIKFK